MCFHVHMTVTFASSGEMLEADFLLFLICTPVLAAHFSATVKYYPTNTDQCVAVNDTLSETA